RPDPACPVSGDAFQVAMREHFGSRREIDITQPAEWTDLHAVAEGDAALQDHVHVDLDIAPMAEMATQIEARRIREAHAFHQNPLRVATAQERRKLRELR